jgi:hypothetical protein
MYGTIARKHEFMLVFEFIANAKPLTGWRSESQAYHLLTLRHLKKIYTDLTATLRWLNDNDIHHMDAHTGNFLRRPRVQRAQGPPHRLRHFAPVRVCARSLELAIARSSCTRSTSDLIAEFPPGCQSIAGYAVAGTNPHLASDRLKDLVNRARDEGYTQHVTYDFRSLLGSPGGKYVIDTQGAINGLIFWLANRPVLTTAAYEMRAANRDRRTTKQAAAAATAAAAAPQAAALEEEKEASPPAAIRLALNPMQGMPGYGEVSRMLIGEISDSSTETDTGTNSATVSMTDSLATLSTPISKLKTRTETSKMEDSGVRRSRDRLSEQWSESSFPFALWVRWACITRLPTMTQMHYVLRRRTGPSTAS